MAFLRFARATVVQPQVGKAEWAKVRTAAKAEANLQENLIDRAASIFETEFNPKQYLLTHATIVASVDVYEPQGVKLGSVLENGFRVNRRYSDFRVTPNTDKFINNNLDCWSRDVLMKSFQTFIGGHNFVEHVQVEDLSRGRIIDAVARDIGDSIYVDILIATDRKHADLVEAIESGKMSTLSMGCTVDGTICTKCGHWAADETEMCPHVKYEKGNTFFDEQGRKHRVAELCGHKTIGPTGGVQFIEASWVGNPAFTGAVMRNILEPTVEISRQAAAILALPPTEWSKDAARKAASRASEGPVVGRVSKPARTGGFFAGWDEGGGEEGGEGEAAPTPAAPAAPANPLDDIEKELETTLLDRVKKKIKERMQGEEAAKVPEDSTSTNENLNKQGHLAASEGMGCNRSNKQATLRVYRVSISSLMRTASSDVEFVNAVAELNAATGINIPVPLYRAALKVGSTTSYPGVQEFVGACRVALGRMPTPAEARTLVRLGKLLTSRSQVRQASNTIPGSRPQDEGDRR